jgi:hypothetical protein
MTAEDVLHAIVSGNSFSTGNRELKRCTFLAEPTRTEKNAKSQAITG